MKHQASDGSIWHIEFNPPPVATRSCDWQYAHEDYDGAPDSADCRCGFAGSMEQAVADIEELIAKEVEPLNPEGDRGPCYLPDPVLDRPKRSACPPGIRRADWGDTTIDGNRE